MENKEESLWKNFKKEFLPDYGRMFPISIKAELAMVLIAGALVSSMIIGIINFCEGYLAPMTETDIEAFIRLSIRYSIPYWWNLAFGIIWTFMFYWMRTSPWFNREVGSIIRNLLMVMIFIAGIYISIIYGGIFYGLIISLAFILLLSSLILIYPWIIKTLFN